MYLRYMTSSMQHQYQYANYLYRIEFISFSHTQSIHKSSKVPSNTVSDMQFAFAIARCSAVSAHSYAAATATSKTLAASC
jgi:hypothetical protein